MFFKDIYAGENESPGVMSPCCVRWLSLTLFLLGMAGWCLPNPGHWNEQCGHDGEPGKGCWDPGPHPGFPEPTHCSAAWTCFFLQVVRDGGEDPPYNPREREQRAVQEALQ